ncbi:MAG: nucleotidyltransferase family protein [Paludibacteraceae bacterium]|nr:nucleotidyltransferase family protein [Paludibacteraceae bacterium]
MVHGLIFAAGLGTRLKPLTDTMPKALVPLAGKPLLQWQVEKLRDAGITDIIVNVHHFPDQIIDAVRANNGWGANITISDERDQLLDTGGGLRKAWREGLLGKDKPVLACNVDILSNIDIRALMAAYNPSDLGLLVVSERPTQRYLLFDEEGLLRGWTNIATGEFKPSSLQGGEGGRLQKLAFSGMQILSPAFFPLLEETALFYGDKFSLIDSYLDVVVAKRKGELLSYIPQNYRMMDVGKIDQITEAESFAESLSDKK